MTDNDKILIETAAVVDAIFTPHRRYTLSADTDQLHAQSYYRREGEPLSNAGTAADRKREERHRRAMHAAGLIDLLRKGGRVVGVKPTVTGYFHASGLAGTVTLVETLGVLKRLQKLIEAGRCWVANDGIRYVEELELAGLKSYDTAGKWRVEVEANETALRFADAAGWVADCCGMTPVDGAHDWTLTPLGVEVLNDPPRIGKPPRFKREAATYYAEVFEANQFHRGMTPEEVARFRTNSAGTVPAETEKQTKTGSNVGKE